jgi:hypothetical protein
VNKRRISLQDSGIIPTGAGRGGAFKPVSPVTTARRPIVGRVTDPRPSLTDSAPWGNESWMLKLPPGFTERVVNGVEDLGDPCALGHREIS